MEKRHGHGVPVNAQIIINRDLFGGRHEFFEHRPRPLEEKLREAAGKSGLVCQAISSELGAGGSASILSRDFGRYVLARYRIAPAPLRSRQRTFDRPHELRCSIVLKRLKDYAIFILLYN